MVPLRAGLHNPFGGIGGRQPAYSTVRSHMVVVVAPAVQHRPVTCPPLAPSV